MQMMALGEESGEREYEYEMLENLADGMNRILQECGHEN